MGCCCGVAGFLTQKNRHFMLERHFTAERLNEIVNHPSIYPWIKGAHTEPLDLTGFAANPANVCFVGEHGCVIFQRHQPGIWEFHTCVLPEGRGQWMLDQWKAVSRWMFTKTDAYELMTKCPDGNLASKAGARAVGCTKMFRTGKIWSVNWELVPVDVYSIILQDWICRAHELAEVGRDFHTRLESKYVKIGKKESIHEKDETHNIYVGATVEMLLAGQVNKAVISYNRWARMTSYAPISVVSYDPLVIDIFEAKLRITDGDFEILA